MRSCDSAHDQARALRRLQRYGRARTAEIALRTGRTVEQVVEDALRAIKRRAQ